MFAALLAMLVPAAPAQAAVSCTANSCDGLYPDAAGCSADKSLLQEVSGRNALIRLYRSPACQSTWAEVTVNQGADNYYAIFWTIAPEGGREVASYTLNYPYGQTSYPYVQTTWMRDWHRSVRVCDQYSIDDRDRFAVPGPTGTDDHLGSVCGEWF
ncbi:DUF2690 domain-containing protein [Kitasatospora sp. NPDC088134]|uniref:DUF2690 domain-containing protein n=1 Tax=Kitasatospora sp. NPDC088134 TaxID=3364071 RepID=UPI00381B8F0F